MVDADQEKPVPDIPYPCRRATGLVPDHSVRTFDRPVRVRRGRALWQVEQVTGAGVRQQERLDLGAEFRVPRA